MVTLNTDLSLLELLVPDALKIFRQRYLILEQISLHAPIGRRNVAIRLGLSERNIRTETENLRKLGLIEIHNYGMVLTEKGESVVKDAAQIVDRLFNASQAEVKLAEKLEIDRTIIVAGDSDLQGRVYDLAGEELNSALNLLLPLADCIVTVMGGKTIAKVAKKLTPSLSENRKIKFVPGRGALGGRVNTESNAIVKRWPVLRAAIMNRFSCRNRFPRMPTAPCFMIRRSAKCYKTSRKATSSSMALA
jgi:central glycolytic genes regulator